MNFIQLLVGNRSITKARKTKEGYSPLALLWNVIDKDTVLASIQSIREQDANASGTVTALQQQAITNSNGYLPNTVNTDAHMSYWEGVSTSLFLM